MTCKRLLDFNIANFFLFFVFLACVSFFNVNVMMIPVLLASKAYNLITDFGEFNVTILVFVAFFVLFPWRSLCFSRRDDDALKVICVSMMMMMLGECWLASRASNLITVITVGIELALTGLSDPTHSYTRAITLITTNIFNKAKSQIQMQIHRQKPSF